MRAIHLILVAGVDDGGHLGGCGVADDHAVASGRGQRFGGRGDLLGNVALVNIHDLDAKGIGGSVENQFTLAAQRIGRTPDGNADEDVILCRFRCGCGRFLCCLFLCCRSR
jgi:hypothetical protein